MAEETESENFLRYIARNLNSKIWDSNLDPSYSMVYAFNHCACCLLSFNGNLVLKMESCTDTGGEK